MARTLVRQATAGVVVGLLAASGLIAPAEAGPPMPLSKAGALVGWGIGIAPPAAYMVPTTLRHTAVSKVICGGGFTVALTGAGKVVVMGRGYALDASMEQIPASLADETVVDIAVGGFSAAAVTSAGNVVVWGSQSELPDAADIPPGLTGVKSVAVGQTTVAAVKDDRTVVAWGGARFGETVVPAGLTGVASLSAGDNHYYALKTDGTVVAWGSNSHDETTLPDELTVPGNVRAVTARSAGGLALLTDGSLVSWGLSAGVPDVLNGIPASLDGKNVVAISALSNNNMALEADGTITVWGLGIELGTALGMEQLQDIPAELAGADVTDIAMGDEHALALVTEVLAVSQPTIAGEAKVGKTLVGTPAVFSGDPTTVVNQWFADGEPIVGATGMRLLLAAAHAGRRITFASTATKEGESLLVSTSEQTSAVEADLVPSTTSVSVAASTYGRSGRVSVSVVNALGRPITGAVQLTGAGATQRVAVSGGTATFSLNRALAGGAYTLTVLYSGSSELAASLGTAALKVGKGKIKAPAFKVNRIPTSSRKGKALVVLASNTALAKASGKATVTLTKGKRTKKIRVTLFDGKRWVSLPILKKGTWKVRVSYRGDKNYAAVKSKWFKLNVKR